nr:hypothetical protein [Kibdelosporangium sp. MJ126-NF4]CTQ88497.1 hypothetical protein [Kibdelosporangium sp. MJ126-NF4]
MLVVPGGAAPAFRAMTDWTPLGYLRDASAHAEVTASVCSGSLLLGAAGLLTGRRADRQDADARAAARVDRSFHMSLGFWQGGGPDQGRPLRPWLTGTPPGGRPESPVDREGAGQRLVTVHNGGYVSTVTP